jgi:hypothetical protein
VQKEYNCNNDMMAGYLAEVPRMEKFFNGLRCDISHLTWIANSMALTLPDVIVENCPSLRSSMDSTGQQQKMTRWKS